MKRLFLLTVAALLSLSACSQKATKEENNDNQTKEMKTLVMLLQDAISFLNEANSQVRSAGSIIYQVVIAVLAIVAIVSPDGSFRMNFFILASTFRLGARRR